MNISKNNVDKTECNTTTSLQFKQDLYDFCIARCSPDSNALELGTYLGYTTRVLSPCFKTVFTVNKTNPIVAKELNEDIDNIVYIQHNLYRHVNNPFELQDVRIQLAFIDADHSRRSVLLDTERCLGLLEKGGYIVYDDYGLSKQVRQAVEAVCEKYNLEPVGKIGKEPSWSYAKNKTLVDYEGIILRVST